jgi:hypothetical protein
MRNKEGGHFLIGFTASMPNPKLGNKLGIRFGLKTRLLQPQAQE